MKINGQIGYVKQLYLKQLFAVKLTDVLNS